MKKTLRTLLVIGSILLGLYVGIWLMFIGGIVQVVNGISPLNGMQIALGISRIVFCGIAYFIPVVGISIAAVLDD